MLTTIAFLGFCGIITAAETERVSVGTGQGDGDSNGNFLSASGRYLTFHSSATNLVPGDTNTDRDIFVRDLKKGTTVRVSVDSSGAQSTGGDSLFPALSANGRFVAFQSAATNLVTGDTNGNIDIFVHDRKQGITTRVSVDSFGAQAIGGASGQPAISANGRFVAFESTTTNLVTGDTNGNTDIFVHDRKQGTTTRVSVDSSGAQATGGTSRLPAISRKGRFVAFRSKATDLVTGDTNGNTDVFVHDRKQATTTRVSVDSSGAQATGGDSSQAAISTSGRFVAFGSAATNLVADDTNALGDVFVRDLEKGTTTRVSVDSAGAQTTAAGSFTPAISAKGRFVAFTSEASNLVTGDTNGLFDVFVHDRKKAATTRVSVDSSGAEATGESYDAVISANGRFVAFNSDATNLVPGDGNALDDIFVHDRKKGRTSRESLGSPGGEGDDDSSRPAISANGRFVAFSSAATNLVPDDTNGDNDIFVYDRKQGTTTRVSVDSSGAQATGGHSSAPAISANGRFVAFDSGATNLVTGDTNGNIDIFVHDRKQGTTTRVSVDSSGAQATGDSLKCVISASGRFVAFDSGATNLVTGDTNGNIDIFVHDRKKGTTTRVSVDSSGTQAAGGSSSNAAISANGRFVAFQSSATNLVIGDLGSIDVFVHDRKKGTTTQVSVDSSGAPASNHSFEPAISANGRFIAFESSATNLVTGDTNAAQDVFVHDRKNGKTTRVSVDSSGAQSDGTGLPPTISANGRFVTFAASATNLVTGDTNGAQDVFVHDRENGKTTRVSVDSAGAQADSFSSDPQISANGRYISFGSAATNLVTGDANAARDIFIHDRK